MYYIAICDNNENFISHIKMIIEECEIKENIEFYEYCNGDKLINDFNKIKEMDLLILDMKLDSIHKDEIISVFRKKFKNTVLVFCSETQMPDINSLKMIPYKYLLKSYTDKQMIFEIKEILNEVRKKLKLQKKYIMGHYRNNVIKVDIQNILYIENAKRGSKVTVCKDCIESEFNAPILVDEKLEMLTKKHFELVFAHRSYIINMVHIEKIVHNLAFLDNGEQLSISRTYQKHIREQFTKYLADNN